SIETTAWSQNQQVKQISSETPIMMGTVQGLHVERNTSNPEPISNSPESETVFVQMSNPNAVGPVSEELIETELTKEEKITLLQHRIESVEAKIFHLMEDEEGNAAEIAEKNAALEAMRVELHDLESN